MSGRLKTPDVVNENYPERGLIKSDVKPVQGRRLLTIVFADFTPEQNMVLIRLDVN
jgi:hypothetical protein